MLFRTGQVIKQALQIGDKIVKVNDILLDRKNMPDR